MSMVCQYQIGKMDRLGWLACRYIAVRFETLSHTIGTGCGKEMAPSMQQSITWYGILCNEKSFASVTHIFIANFVLPKRFTRNSATKCTTTHRHWKQ